MHLWTCQACERPIHSYFNDTPFDVQLTAGEAEARGLADDTIVEWPCAYGMFAWGIVRVVATPVDVWPALGQKPAKKPKEARP